MTYILVTTARNESANLRNLINSVLSQTIKPALWFIMNDNSTDDTEQILEDASRNYSFIKFENLGIGERDLTFRYHQNMSYGFKKAALFCMENKIAWEYIGVLDGDIFLDSINYYQLLINQLEVDSSLVIISGVVLSYNGKSYIEESTYKKEKPRGANRLIRKSFYEEIGYPIVPSADSVMIVLAFQKKYHCVCIEEAVAKQSRLTTSERDDYFSGKYVGRVKYILGYSVIYSILKSIYLLLKLKPQMALGFAVSYIKCFVLREKRIEIEDVRRFYGKKILGT